MATHSSILAWRIPQTEEPGRLWSIGSQRVGHDSSDLAHTHIALKGKSLDIPTRRTGNSLINLSSWLVHQHPLHKYTHTHMSIYTFLFMVTSASAGRTLLAKTENKTIALVSVFFPIMPRLCLGWTSPSLSQNEVSLQLLNLTCL